MEIKQERVKMKCHQGFTLVEVMIAMLIAGIVMASIFSAFQSQQRSYTTQEQVAEMQQNIRAGMNIMVADLRMAGYDPDDDGDATITSATATAITFSLLADTDGVDNDNDGTTDEAGELKIISYDVYDAYGDGDTDIGRQVGTVATTKRAVAENIDALEFWYTLANGTQTLTPADPELIRTVQVSVVARSSSEDPKYTNTNTYISASGATLDLNGATAGTGNPPNDNFRRRLLMTTIQCRNMGL